MKAGKDNPMKPWVMAAAVLMAAAVPLGVIWTLGQYGSVERMVHDQVTRNPESQLYKDTAYSIVALKWNIGLEWVAVGIASVGVVLLVLVALRRPAAEWLKVAALAPVVYLLFSAAPQSVSGELLPLARMALAVAAAAAYMPVVLRIPGRLQYGVCCCSLGVAAVFFYQWEPPPPKPVPIRNPLTLLQKNLLSQLNGPRERIAGRPAWTGTAQTLTPDVEKVLGADEYLQLTLDPPGGAYKVVVFVTYNANARSLVPHVPWVCMPEAGFQVAELRQDDVPIPAISSDKEISMNVALMAKGEGMQRQKALVFHYLNVGGTYTTSREVAKFLANAGAIGRTGSYISQTQVVVWLPPRNTEDPLAKNSAAYRTCLEMVNLLVPLLEHDHYPDLRAGAGG